MTVMEAGPGGPEAAGEARGCSVPGYFGVCPGSLSAQKGDVSKSLSIPTRSPTLFLILLLFYLWNGDSTN